MEKTLRNKLLYYLVISAISFSYLILPHKAGISVPIFVVIQFICLFFIVPKRKTLFIFIPIFILALNSFISGNSIWYVSNFIVTVILYSFLVLLNTDGFSFMETSVKFMVDTVRNILAPFNYFSVPVQWSMDANKAQMALIKRILVGVAIALPCLIVLIMVLSSADQIFSSGVGNVFTYLHSIFNFSLIFKIVCGLVAGFYLFGMAYAIYQPKKDLSVNNNFKSGDLLIINIVLISILCVYTIFAIIQFRYLFASGSQLPYGLTYTSYARRGFFELLFLSGINIFMILLTLKLIPKPGITGARLTKILCCYLCLITFVLLISSFYRMWLYNFDGGLTRLRFLVFGFLIFEAIGLVFTFIYIIKPKFNISATYLLIGLVYYLLLNLVPMDAIIAKDQIDRYLATGKGDLDYTLSLSSDAAPQIARLMGENDKRLIKAVTNYYSSHIIQASDWRSFNLSAEKCRLIYVQETAKADAEPANYKTLRPIVNPWNEKDTTPEANQAGLITGLEEPTVLEFFEEDFFLPHAAPFNKPGIIEAAYLQQPLWPSKTSLAQKLPPNTKFYAVEKPIELKMGWQIEENQKKVALIKVVANSPEYPIVLVLNGNQRMVWQIARTEATRIMAVLVLGDAWIMGLPEDVPILQSSSSNTNQAIRKLFGGTINKIFKVENGKVVIGKKLPWNAKLISNIPILESDAVEVVSDDFTSSIKPTTNAFHDLKLPPNTKIYAVGALDKRTEMVDSNQREQLDALVKVVVNSPHNPVVLMLGGHESTVWDITKTENTNIIAVFASEDHAAKITTLPPNIPLLARINANGEAYRNFYMDCPEAIVNISNISKQLFGQGIESIYGAIEDLVVVGEALPVQDQPITHKNDKIAEINISPGDFSPLPGQAGLTEAVRNGLLRWPKANELQQYIDAQATNKKAATSRYGGVRPNVYVVLSQDFIIPDDLFGANAVTFLLPPGVTQPRGPVSHCTFISLE